MQLPYICQAPGLSFSIYLTAGLLGLSTLCGRVKDRELKPSRVLGWWAIRRRTGTYPPSSVTLSTTEPVPKARTSELPSELPPRPLSLLRPAGPQERESLALEGPGTLEEKLKPYPPFSGGLALTRKHLPRLKVEKKTSNNAVVEGKPSLSSVTQNAPSQPSGF